MHQSKKYNILNEEMVVSYYFKTAKDVFHIYYPGKICDILQKNCDSLRSSSNILLIYFFLALKEKFMIHKS